MPSLVVPKLNANDDACVLRAWQVEDGATVEAEQIVASLETSKATFELLAPSAGVLQRRAREGDTHPCGAEIGHIFPSREALEADRATRAAAAPEALTLTRGARELSAAHGLSEAELSSLGKSVIKAADVEALIARRSSRSDAAPSDGSARARRQAQVARTVSLSHATIPASYLVMRVDTDRMSADLLEWSSRHGAYAGFPEILIKIVAGLAGELPAFFRGDQGVPPGADPDVGLTFDVGHGLFIPVVKHAHTRSLGAIATAVMELRDRAFLDSFSVDDLSGGHITLSLMAERDVVLSIPIILPGQTCMISVGAVLEELRLTADGRVEARHFMNLGIAYDHRTLNGSHALRFARAIKARFEAGLSPELLA